MTTPNVLPNQTESTSDTVRDVLALLKVATVVVVDDIYEREISLGDATGLIKEIIDQDGFAALSTIFAGQVDFQVPERVWRQKLSELWEDYDEARRMSLVMGLYKELGSHQQLYEDMVTVRALERLMPGTIDYRQLSPQKWEQQQSDLLGEASEDKRLLVLFDKDMKGEERSFDGARLLAAAYSPERREKVILAMLSGKFRIDEEKEIARELNIGLTLGQWIPLAKERLYNEDSSQFPEGIKLAALNYCIEGLLDEAQNVIKSSIDSADAEFRNIHAYDLHHLVKYSQTEGVWETNTFLRLLNVLQRDKLRELAEASGQRAKFNELTDLVVKIRAVPPVHVGGKQVSSVVRQIGYRELYSQIQMDNQLFTPVRLGDIFTINDGKEYILLAQPCDLIMRLGRRTELVSLVRIRPRKPNDDESFVGSLPYYRDGIDWAVAYKDYISLPISLLEMAVFDHLGRCSMSLTDPPYPGLSNRWADRYRDIQQEMKELYDNLALIDRYLVRPSSPQDKDRLRRAVAARFRMKAPAREVQRVSFPVQRTGHFREPGAQVLLRGFTDVASRLALPGDFLKGTGEEAVVGEILVDE